MVDSRRAVRFRGLGGGFVPLLSLARSTADPALTGHAPYFATIATTHPNAQPAAITQAQFTADFLNLSRVRYLARSQNAFTRFASDLLIGFDSAVWCNGLSLYPPIPFFPSPDHTGLMERSYPLLLKFRFSELPHIPNRLCGELRLPSACRYHISSIRLSLKRGHGSPVLWVFRAPLFSTGIPRTGPKSGQYRDASIAGHPVRGRGGRLIS